MARANGSHKADIIIQSGLPNEAIGAGHGNDIGEPRHKDNASGTGA